MLTPFIEVILGELECYDLSWKIWPFKFICVLQGAIVTAHIANRLHHVSLVSFPPLIGFLQFVGFVT